MFTFGEIRIAQGDSRRFQGSGNLIFVAWGGFGTLWVGGAVGVFENRK